MAVWLTLEELAGHLKMGKSTLYRLAQDRQMPAHKVGGVWRFDRDEVDSWVKRHRSWEPVRSQQDLTT